MLNKKYRRLSSCLRYWNECGNNCRFCFEKYPTFLKNFHMFPRHSLEAFRRNNEALRRFIYESDPYDIYTFKMMGGQLFQFTDRDMFTGMRQTLDFVYKVLEDFDVYRNFQTLKYNAHVFLLSSNLLFEDQSLLYYTLDQIKAGPKVNSRMMFSFDMHDRFRDGDAVQLFYRNYMEFQRRYGDVALPILSFVMTKNNMRAIYDDEDTVQMKYFKTLYDAGKHFDITVLANDSSVPEMKYDYEDMVKFRRKLQERYPKLLKVFTNKNYHSLVWTKYVTVQDAKVDNELQYYDKDENVGGVGKCLVCDKYNVCSQMLPQRDYNVTDCDVKAIFLDGGD